jgi:hypothetical protein
MAARFDKSSVLGVKEAIAAFRRVDPVMRARLNDATEDTVMALAAEARRNVAVDTGILREHLAWSMSASTGRGRVGLRPGVVLDNKNRRHRATNYGHLVEFGFNHRGGRRVQGQPFMIPATERERLPFLERCRAAGKRVEQDLTIGKGML